MCGIELYTVRVQRERESRCCWGGGRGGLVEGREERETRCWGGIWGGGGAFFLLLIIFGFFFSDSSVVVLLFSQHFKSRPNLSLRKVSFSQK